MHAHLPFFHLPLRWVSLFVAIGVLFVSCDDDAADDAPAPILPVIEVNDLVTLADSVDRTVDPPETVEVRPYTYYSLRTNQELTNADSNSTNWDVAFKGTTIRINNGISGPGQGLAVVIEDAFENVVEAPADNQMHSDSSTVDYAIPTGSDNGWYNYNFVTNVISPLPGRTIVVKLADGSGYAKIRIRSYYRGAPANPDPETDEARVYSFDYVVNTDGTRKLQ